MFSRLRLLRGLSTQFPRENLLAPSLRLHNLTGKLAGKQAVSITYAYRIVLCVEITEHEVILHNIGSHDEVYG